MGIKINDKLTFNIEAGKILVKIIHMGRETKSRSGILLPEQQDPEIRFREAKVVDVSPALDDKPEVQTDKFFENQKLMITREAGSPMSINMGE